VKLLSVTATIGGFLFGYDIGFISGALLFIKRDLPMSDLQEVAGYLTY